MRVSREPRTSHECPQILTMADKRYPQVVPQAVDVLKSIEQLYNGIKKGGTSSRNTPKALARMRNEEVELTEQRPADKSLVE